MCHLCKKCPARTCVTHTELREALQGVGTAPQQQRFHGIRHGTTLLWNSSVPGGHFCSGSLKLLLPRV